MYVRYGVDVRYDTDVRYDVDRAGFTRRYESVTAVLLTVGTQ